MNRARWWIVGSCVAGWMVLAWSLDWFTAQYAAGGVKESGRLAYRPVEDMPPRVDLASIQRGWPDSLHDPAESRRLVSYLRDMEGKAPPPSAASPRPAATPEPDFGTLLAAADATVGKTKAQACVSCHDFTDGGPDRIGPNLWHVVGRPLASRPGFAYSPAMAGRGGAWTYELLYDFLAHPARTMPGTRMSYAGLRRPEDRAALIRYLATLGGNPLPMPRPQTGGDVKAR